MTTAQRIRRLRQEKGLTQWQLSQAVGITPGAMLLIERGHKDCTARMIADIAKALDVAKEELEGDDG